MKNSNNCRGAFIEKATKIHGDVYEYSRVDYVNNYAPAEIAYTKSLNLSPMVVGI